MVKVLLVSSPKQASVERRFSINRAVIVLNQKEMSLMAQSLMTLSGLLEA